MVKWKRIDKEEPPKDGRDILLNEDGEIYIIYYVKGLWQTHEIMGFPIEELSYTDYWLDPSDIEYEE